MVRLCAGLTGDLGAGKSAIGQALQARGAWVIDADEVGRQVLGPGSVGEQAVLARFGPAVAAASGSLDRQALARVVFADAGARRALESITHPLIEQEVARRVAGLPEGVVVIELPLLDAHSRRRLGLDVVVLVEAPQEVKLRRAVANRGMTEHDARARLAVQPAGHARRGLADRVVVNAGTREDLEALADELWAWLVSLAEGKAAGPRRPP